MLLYTWKDVERKLLLNKVMWKEVILDIETYTDEMIVYLSEKNSEDSARQILKDILGANYDDINNKILLDLSDGNLEVLFDIGEETENNISITPLFKKVLYQQSAYYNELIEKELPGVPVIAFHSYKGGVGRTLSLLAFVKAWSSLKDLKSKKKLLIVDADIEAPGITWLTAGEEPVFSFLDLLEIIQKQENAEEVIELVAEKVSELTVKIETDENVFTITVALYV